MHHTIFFPDTLPEKGGDMKVWFEDIDGVRWYYVDRAYNNEKLQKYPLFNGNCSLFVAFLTINRESIQATDHIVGCLFFISFQ
jgi:hypothetical protein